MSARIWPVLAIFALWQAVCAAALVPAFVLPPPLRVFETLWQERGLIGQHALTTLAETGAGLALGIGLGITLALAMSLAPRLQRLIGPVLAGAQALPVFVLAPVLVLWLGYGLGPKVAMVALLVVFPVASGLHDGLCATPAPVLDLARIARASKLRTLLWLRLPHALPQGAAGLRIAVTYAPTGAVIGEWVGASSGLGYLMLMANARMRIDLMFAALLVILALTLLLNRLTDRALARAGL